MPLLLQAEGVGWKLEIFGSIPSLPPFIKQVPPAAILIEGALSIRVLDPAAAALVQIQSGAPIAPLFFEAVAYDIHLDKRADANVVLTLPPGADARMDRPDREHHAMNFGNNVGFVDIGVQSASGRAKFRLEVFSRKVDYRTDYVAMREEISAILRNLAMTVNAKTYGLAAPASGHKPTLNEWFALVRHYFDEFIKLTQAIAKKPHSELEVRSVKRGTEQARKVGRHAIDRALRRSNSGPIHPRLGIALPRKIDEEVSGITFDTAVNRYYKGLLQETHRKIRELSKINETGDEDAENDSERKFFDAIRPDLKTMERRIEAAIRAPFLGGVGEGAGERPATMVFHKHPVYSRVEKMARLLNGGLSFAGDIVPIGVKNTALIYEYWCFLKIVDLLRERFDLEEQSIVKLNPMRTVVTLAKGKQSAMKFIHAPTGKALYVVYNRLFNRLPTIAQQPDNVIQIASESRFYIFDAKYRIQFDAPYVKQYGGPGPTTDDINTMHRYRDAIAIPHPMKPKEYEQGVVIGAVVLFPLPDEEAYQQQKFYKSIEQVEIGGLPFLPNATRRMAEKLGSLLASEYSDEPVSLDDQSR